MVAKTSSTGKDPALSLFSHVTVPIQGTRMKEKRPPILADGELTPLTCSRRIPSTGGHIFWRHRLNDDSFTWDACWALSPRYVWGCLISDVLTHGGVVNGGLTHHLIAMEVILYQVHLIPKTSVRVDTIGLMMRLEQFPHVYVD